MFWSEEDTHIYMSRVGKRKGQYRPLADLSCCAMADERLSGDVSGLEERIAALQAELDEKRLELRATEEDKVGGCLVVLPRRG